MKNFSKRIIAVILVVLTVLPIGIMSVGASNTCEIVSTPKDNYVFGSFGCYNVTNGVKIYMGSNQNAIKNRVIYRKEGSGSYKKIANVSTKDYTDTNVKNSKTYTYKIEFDGTINKQTKHYKYELPIRFISAVKLTKIANESSCVHIYWNKVDSITRYEVYRNGSKIAETKSTNYSDKNVSNGKIYEYYVKAVYEKDCKTYSGTNQNTLKIARMNRPTLDYVSCPAPKTLKVVWEKIPSVTGYQVYYATKSDFSNAKYVNVKGDANLSTQLTGLSTTTYYVKIRGYRQYDGITNYSCWSSVIKRSVNKV